jgi:photosystem II stability/assembly factor-like uncharacterized protein
MKFYDAKHGISIGDPIDGCVQLITTDDGGESWKEGDCTTLPKAEPNEAFFAASNTNIDVYSKHIWFASGGMRTRVFHSDDSGKHYQRYNSPLPQGEKMTGIYSIDFFDETTGAIAGGNYDRTDSGIVSLAITRDGGSAWKTIKSKKPFFGSCVQFRNSNEIFVTGHNGTFRYNIKNGKITEVKDKAGAELKFFTLRFTPSGKALWLAGSKGSIGLIYLPETTKKHESVKGK